MKLRGGGVWQVLGLYLAGGWVVLQVVDVLADNVGLPSRVFTLALVLLVVGFPIALITAMIQGSPTSESPPGDSVDGGDRGFGRTARSLFTWRNLGLGALMASALWGVVAIGWMIRSGNAADRLEERVFPLDTSQKPMYQLLGTPDEHKRHVVADGGHDVPRSLLIRETLDWLDTYLGPVER